MKENLLPLASSYPQPYPNDTRAKGWRFELDHERIRQSDTWALAPAPMRPWLLMLWMTAWEQTPCGSLPNDDALISARIGMELAEFVKNKATLMRGWWLADNGRLHHDFMSSMVLAMLEVKKKEQARKSAYRGKGKGAAGNGDQNLSAGYGGVGQGGADFGVTGGVTGGVLDGIHQSDDLSSKNQVSKPLGDEVEGKNVPRLSRVCPASATRPSSVCDDTGTGTSTYISKEDTHLQSHAQGCVSVLSKKMTASSPPQIAEGAPPAAIAGPPGVDASAEFLARSLAAAMRRAGLKDVGDRHPDLLRAASAGISPDQAQSAAEIAVARKKSFNFAMGVLRNQWMDAKHAATRVMTDVAKLPWDKTRTTIEDEGVRVGVGRWDQAKFEVGRGEAFAQYTDRVRKAREAAHG